LVERASAPVFALPGVPIDGVVEAGDRGFLMLVKGRPTIQPHDCRR
jgi:hypothetical protein